MNALAVRLDQDLEAEYLAIQDALALAPEIHLPAPRSGRAHLVVWALLLLVPMLAAWAWAVLVVAGGGR